ncbi:hypothetical protein MLD52_15935 [Puniceicoccaceae bacterium K14]|nr:hypothetical protein [Puniceicoccaceae bacterium K14]
MPTIYQTSRAGDSMTELKLHSQPQAVPQTAITVDSNKKFQTLRGFGGAFTESSAYVMSLLSDEKRQEVLEAYFSPSKAGYTLMRSHIGSCDFSLSNYSYARVEGDASLEHFSIDHDRRWVLPLIQDAMQVEGADFKIVASPWTAPPWMKDNNDWNGGSLKPEYSATFANYIVRYIKAYADEGIDIWGLTPENEPQGNDSNWESMHFSPEEMTEFIARDLGPLLKQEKLDTKVFVFDQNRNHVEEWTDTILGNEDAAQYVAGTAVHWYSSTVDYYGEILDRVHNKFPQMEIIQSEGCIDALGDDEPEGVWLESDWYWRKEATDWGYIWATDEEKPDHPMYAPVYRYIRDMIGTMNHWVTGWIDWNIALDFNGGPNHASNFCGAPVLIDGKTQTVFYTPLYYAMCHFSRFIRPGAVRIDIDVSDDSLMATAASNADGSTSVVVFNEGESDKVYSLVVDETNTVELSIPAQAIQTLVFKN